MKLDELQAVVDAASKGEWRYLSGSHGVYAGSKAVCTVTGRRTIAPDHRREANAAFIATFNPALVAKMIAALRLSRAVAFSNGFDAAYPDKLAALKSALRELES